MRRFRYFLLLITALVIGSRAGAQDARQDVTYDEQGNRFPWYAPPTEDERRVQDRSGMVDVTFAPAEVKMIQPAPAAAQATRYSDYPVSYSMGLVDVSIPLYTVQSRSLSLPIYLSYNSGGVRVEDISGPVGLGWTLEAGGVITRSVNGWADEDVSGWIARPNDDPTSPSYQNDTYLKNVAEGNADPSADLYSFNFCGHKGSFYIDWTTIPFTIVPTTATDLDIQITIGGFVITDTNGTKYYFYTQEKSGRTLTYTLPYFGSGGCGLPGTMEPVTAWYLDSITAMDGTDDISFEYDTMGSFVTSHHTDMRTYQFTYVYIANGNYQWLDSSGQWVVGPPAVSTMNGAYVTRTGYTPKYIKSISFSGGTITFSYKNNPAPYNTSDPRRSYPKLLSAFRVNPSTSVSADTSSVLRCTFSHKVTLDKRNLLDGVSITGKNGTAIDSYSLTYINESTNMLSYDRDLFGYYNASSNSGTAFLRLFNDNGTFIENMANRNYNQSAVSYLSLETITRSSGVKTKFFYEGNSISTGGLSPLFSTIGIGHRISHIVTYDLSQGSETAIRTRRFEYGSQGITLPVQAFTHQAFLSVGEQFREDLTTGFVWWCGLGGNVFGVPRTVTVSFSDQSTLSGVPLESARIYYGSVTERVCEGLSGESVRTDYLYNSSGAVHSISGGFLPTDTEKDTHDNNNNTQGQHSYHFFQRMPPQVLRQSGSPSVSIVPFWAHYEQEDFPQISSPTTIKKYKYVNNTDVLISQTDNVYDNDTDEFYISLRVNNLIDAGNPNNMANLNHVADYYRDGIHHKRKWHRLSSSTETEWLDDGSYYRAVTSYTYIPPSNAVPAAGSILTPWVETTVIDGDAARTYTRRKLFPYQMSSAFPWAAALASRGYRQPFVNLLYIGPNSEYFAGSRAETWGIFSPADGVSGTLVRPASVTVNRPGSDGTTMARTVNYDAYDHWGNPLQISENGQPTRTYLWSYGGLRPVVEVLGDTYSNVRTAISGYTVDNLASGTPTDTQLTYIQSVLQPSNDFSRQASWFMYDVFSGISATRDISGRQTNYGYDGAGRLMAITDEDNNFVKTYLYALTNGSTGVPNSFHSITQTSAGALPFMGVHDVAYYDGLERTIQSIAVGASLGNKDLITPVTPDFLDRKDARVYVPYADFSSASSGSYRSNALAMQQSFYGSGTKAYTENTYETSARGRIVASSLPGFTETTTVTTASSAANTVLNLSYDRDNNALSASGYYSQGRFTVTTTTGPDGSVTESYTDEFGTPVLERVTLDALGTKADAYYIKDKLGRVNCVVPPDQAALLTSSTSAFPAVNCYTYEYDGRDRVIRKQLPGQAAETYTYNGADLPLTRTRTAADGNAVEVYETTYDAFNRPTLNAYQYGTNTAITLAEYAYDSYPSWAPAFAAESGYVSTSDKDTRTRGLPTAERITLLPGGVSPSALTPSNTAAQTARAFYYDAKGNVRQVAQADATGGTTRTSSSYGFTGNLLAERQRITPASGQTEHTLDRTYTYDGRLRQASVTASLDGGSAASQTYSYGLRQQLNVINRANDLEKTTLGYTLQDWLTTSNSTSWEETLRYQSPSRTATDALPGKAGLITEWTQQQKGTSADGATTAETYAYSYDKAGRLTGSLRYIDTSTSSVNTLTEQSITYDRSGNLLTLNRFDASSGTTPSESLSLSYSGPKRTGWGYDSHGNVTSDPVGGSTMAWNVLDMPRTISSGTAGIQRSYLADGTLVQVSDGSTIRLYLGDMVFNQTSGTISLESAAWDGGLLLPGSGTDKVLYYVTDHLGSVRVVKDGSGNIRQRYDYYPYGSVTRSWTSSSTSTPDKRYRFSGKEIAGMALGALSSGSDKYLDFGARLYSPGTAMWLSQDPMAESYYRFTPYLYCAGSPGNVVDPEGRTITIWYSNNGRLCSFVFSGVETDIPDNDYVKSVIEAYYYNKDNWQKAGFNGNSPSTELVEGQDIKISVYKNLSFDSKYYRGNGGIPYLIWNPAEGLMSENGTVLSPATIFAHEADHALDDLKDAKAHSDRVSQRLEGYTNQEEFRVITGSEQLTARANGEIAPGQVTRYNHKGKTVYTSGVTSNVVDPSATRYFYKHLFKSRRVW